MRRILITVLAVTAAGLATSPGAEAASTPTPTVTMPAPAITVHAHPGQKICTARADVVQGAYRLYNDTFAVPGDPMCIRDDGTGDHTALTVKSNLAPYQGRVVAYPAVQFGRWDGYVDSASHMPVVEGAAGRIMLHVRSTGRAAGIWQDDIDLWAWPTSNVTTKHAGFELVIVNRASSNGTSAPYARVFHRTYSVSSWLTCTRNSAGSCVGALWRLAYFKLKDPDDVVRLHVASFLSYCRRHHWISPHWWIGEVSYGTEIWSKGKGLKDGLFLLWPPKKKK
jgi:hypothetical protein